MQIFTHRGLEPSKKDFFSESSFEAFNDHLSRGFGLEFDPCFFTDDKIGVVHAATVSAAIGGEDQRKMESLSSAEFLKLQLPKGRYCLFAELLEEIDKNRADLHALHLKGKFQEERLLDLLLAEINKYPTVVSKLLIFDLKPPAAKYLKENLPGVALAPSVAHPFDIERYNEVVKGTLFSIDEAIAEKNTYSWVWLDEWDLLDKGGKTKEFYTAETFDALRKHGYKIALVTPELHATSPGLLGGEAHSDAANQHLLFERIQDILELKPDAVCTDYPEEIRQMID
jgi:hypothetical protein